jgi:LPS-assembly protein
MKNKFFLFIVFFLTFTFKNIFIFAGELNIDSSTVQLDKNSKTVVLRGEVRAEDDLNNVLFADFARYNKDSNKLETSGNTKIITSEGFEVEGNNILFDNKNKVISSNDLTTIIDKDGNNITVEMFNYQIKKNTFSSKGNIKLIDIKNNEYKFSEIVIDEKSGIIAGSDVKFFLNDKDIKQNKNNEPRLFANSMTLNKGESVFEKGVFTFCKDMGKDSCPPWQLRAEKINHNITNKTIYYDNAVIKVYDFPIFYAPKFSHPDPTVKRRSGLLVPSFYDNSTVGAGITVPYFWSIAQDKDLTFTPKIYNREHPLLLAEYRQNFKNSNLIIDAGHTNGYKKKTTTKLPGSRLHLFSKFYTNFSDSSDTANELELNLQHVSNDTYLKIHDINTSLADDSINTLENTLNYTYQDEDIFFGATASAFESLNKTDNSKYEYLLPFLAFEKNLLADDKLGYFDLSTNLQVRNYDVNSQTEFLVNDINWKSNKWINKLGIENRFESLVKTVNYNASKTDEFKNKDNVAELSGGLGYSAELGLYKNDTLLKTNHLFKPKMLVRYAPGHMRNINTNSARLNYSNLFDLNKTNEIDVVENGLSTSIGFEYSKNELKKDRSIGDQLYSFSAGQVISPDENIKMPSSTSMDQNFSDVVGQSSLNIKKNIKINYNFAIDQGYSEINYNELGAAFDIGKTKFNVNYLEEKNHIGSNEFVKTDIGYSVNDSNKLSFSTKRNLLTNSSEFYNLSYDYINDCLKAGIVFRREFYNDRDVEPDNQIMFRISLVPFAEINTPNVNK